MENPNELDREDPQVMSPNDSHARSRSGVASGQVVNGVDPPLRGRLDLDGEVTAQGNDLELGSGPVPQGPETHSSQQGQVAPPTSAGDFLQGPVTAAKTSSLGILTESFASIWSGGRTRRTFRRESSSVAPCQA